MIPFYIAIIAEHLYESETKETLGFDNIPDAVRHRYISKAYALVDALKKHQYGLCSLEADKSALSQLDQL